MLSGPDGGRWALARLVRLCLSISSSDILALFNDGGVDVAALLMSPDISGRRVNENHSASDFYASIAGSGLEGSAAAGLVSP